VVHLDRGALRNAGGGRKLRPRLVVPRRPGLRHRELERLARRRIHASHRAEIARNAMRQIRQRNRLLCKGLSQVLSTSSPSISSVFPPPPSANVPWYVVSCSSSSVTRQRRPVRSGAYCGRAVKRYSTVVASGFVGSVWLNGSTRLSVMAQK